MKTIGHIRISVAALMLSLCVLSPIQCAQLAKMKFYGTGSKSWDTDKRPVHTSNPW